MYVRADCSWCCYADDDETTQTEAEGSMGYYKDPQGPRIDMGFDTFLINTLLYEVTTREAKA